MSEPPSPLEAPVADETAAAPVVALAAGETVEDSIVRWTKALKVKDKQIVLVSTQNEQLRSSMGMLETELQELSKTLLAKESQLHLKEREIEKRDDEIRRLTALEQQENGKERAIEIASTQNGQLLSLLEVHEGKTKLLTEERDKLTEELKDLKIMHAAQMRRDGATDAKLRVELSESQDAFNHLSLEHQDLTMRHNGFEELVRNTERDARAAVQTTIARFLSELKQTYIDLLLFHRPRCGHGWLMSSHAEVMPPLPADARGACAAPPSQRPPHRVPPQVVAVGWRVSVTAVACRAPAMLV